MRKKLIVIGLFLFALFGAKMTCNAAEVLQSTDFENGVSLPWNVSEINEGNSYSKVVDGAYVVHINPSPTGPDVWDIQIRHKEFKIVTGHTYKVSFRVKADKSITIRAKVGDADKERSWKEFWFQEVSVNNSWKTVSGEFTPGKNGCPEGYNIVEFAVHFGAKYLNGNKNFDIYFDDFSMTDDQFKPTAIPKPTPERLIRVNQLGYYPMAAKKATMVSSATSPQDVQLKDSSGNIVWEGKSTPKSGVDKASGEKVHIIDFSDCTKEGKNYQLVSGSMTSFQFDIGMDMYSKLKYDSLKYFYHARSGIDIEMPYCVDKKWAREAGHMEDSPSLYPGRDYKWNGEVREYTGGPANLDAVGGWYDAGDHGKYVVNGGVSTWTVQNQYEWAKSKGITDFDDNKLTIPESGNDWPDLLDETRWNMAVFLKLQIPEGCEAAGMVVHKVADEFWTPLATLPVDDDQTRYYYPPSTCATLNFAACAAQASRLWEPYDKAFADQCLEQAEIAWQAALDNPDVIAPYGQETGSGTYGDDNPADEFYWAACELFITTEKTDYLEYIQDSKYAFKIVTVLEGESDNNPGSLDWGNVSACGTIDILLNAKKCKYAGMNSGDIDAAKESLAAAADYYIGIQATEGYGVPLQVSDYTSEFSGLKREIKDGYPWGSNSFIENQSMIMAYAYAISGDVKYINGCIEAMDYLMGRNPNLKCYITGYGENPVKYPHHRFFCPQIDPSFPSAPPGFMCGGPNSGCQDPWMSGSGIEGSAAQKCYLDHVESWASNEVTINWNAPLAWLTAFLDKEGPEIGPKETPTPTPTPTPKDPKAKCDLNKDGVVNMKDVVLIAKAFNTAKGDSKYVLEYDLNGDGAINMKDVTMIAKYFNQVVGN